MELSCRLLIKLSCKPTTPSGKTKYLLVDRKPHESEVLLEVHLPREAVPVPHPRDLLLLSKSQPRLLQAVLQARRLKVVQLQYLPIQTFLLLLPSATSWPTLRATTTLRIPHLTQEPWRHPLTNHKIWPSAQLMSRMMKWTKETWMT